MRIVLFPADAVDATHLARVVRQIRGVQHVIGLSMVGGGAGRRYHEPTEAWSVWLGHWPPLGDSPENDELWRKEWFTQMTVTATHVVPVTAQAVGWLHRHRDAVWWGRARLALPSSTVCRVGLRLSLTYAQWPTVCPRSSTALAVGADTVHLGPWWYQTDALDGVAPPVDRTVVVPLAQPPDGCVATAVVCGPLRCVAMFGSELVGIAECRDDGREWRDARTTAGSLAAEVAATLLAHWPDPDGPQAIYWSFFLYGTVVVRLQLHPGGIQLFDDALWGQGGLTRWLTGSRSPVIPSSLQLAHRVWLSVDVRPVVHRTRLHTWRIIAIDLDDTLLRWVSAAAWPDPQIDLWGVLLALGTRLPLVLVTRHRHGVENVQRLLRYMRLDMNFFDRVVHVVDDKYKASHVTECGLLIDDDEHERRQWERTLRPSVSPEAAPGILRAAWHQYFVDQPARTFPDDPNPAPTPPTPPAPSVVEASAAPAYVTVNGPGDALIVGQTMRTSFVLLSSDEEEEDEGDLIERMRECSFTDSSDEYCNDDDTVGRSECGDGRPRT